MISRLRAAALVLVFLALAYLEYLRYGKVEYGYRDGAVHSITLPRHLWEMNREKYLDENPTIREVRFSD